MSVSVFLRNISEQVMITFAIGILLILFMPIPSWCLDLLLICNFSWALTILLLAFYTDKPLSFSTFPSLLLMSTLFRLALNVSATRLILSDADAGNVIGAIGQYVINDNYVMGIVVFLILIIVQFIVVTNGAQRVAEVAARFTLDSMPGKQMSIDADLNMGLISQKDARFKRTQIEKEASFYGAMDGASKFVKGDAIAGILIMLVDILGGLGIGMIQKGLTLSEALHTYSLLTVGDGLVTQIPALTISLATGIIVTRAASDAELGNEVAKQIAAYPKSLLMVCLCLLLMLFVKGLPFFPVFIIFCLFSIAFSVTSMKNTDLSLDENSEIPLYEKIKVHPIELRLHPKLYEALKAHETDITNNIQHIREHIAYAFGFVMPEVTITSDNHIAYPHYTLLLNGHSSGENPLHLDKLLVIASQENLATCEGISVKEPCFGFDAKWISADKKHSVASKKVTVTTPIQLLINHLKETTVHKLSELLTRRETEILLNQTNLASLRDELIPSILSLSHVQRVLQHLLQEKVSIRHIHSILEVLLEHGKLTQDTHQLAEYVRAKLATMICQPLLNQQQQLTVLTLCPSLEQQLSQNIVNQTLALEPSLTEHLMIALANHVEKMLKHRHKPVLLCSSILRRHIKQLTQRLIPQLTVLGMNEIPLTISLESFSVIQ